MLLRRVRRGAVRDIGILVDNAGTNPAFGPVVDQDRGRFMKTLEINYLTSVERMDGMR